MCFQSQSFGSLHSLVPNAPENNPTVFFPRLSGNDLTTARKRNVKHSLELFVTSERWGGPCSSASLDIPEHTQPKTPNSWGRLLPLSNSKTIPRKETLSLTSGSLLFTGVSREHCISQPKTFVFTCISYICNIFQHNSSSSFYDSSSLCSASTESVLYCLTACESLSLFGLLSSVKRQFGQKLTEKCKTNGWLNCFLSKGANALALLVFTLADSLLSFYTVRGEVTIRAGEWGLVGLGV